MGMKHVETGARAFVTVLVTGFGAFPGAPRNPSAAILGRLHRHRGRLRRLGIDLRTSLLPVVFDRIGPALAAAQDAVPPDVVLLLGLASRRRVLCVETRALNRAGPLHPDAARRRAAPVLVAGGPAMLKATYPAARVAAAIRAGGTAARLSIDAGDYVCNAALYLALVRHLAPMAGFLHVPRVRSGSQPLHRRRRGRPSVEDLTGAVLRAVLVVGPEAFRRAPGRPGVR